MVWSKIKTFVVVTGDKDSIIVIVKKTNYAANLEIMIHGGIIIDTWTIWTTDNMLKDLSLFQEFLYRNFYYYKCY